MDIRKPNDFELKKVLSLSPQAVFDGTLGEVKPTKEKKLTNLLNHFWKKEAIT